MDGAQALYIATDGIWLMYAGFVVCAWMLAVRSDARTIVTTYPRGMDLISFSEEKLLMDRCQRLTAVEQGPDGNIYLLTDEMPPAKTRSRRTGGYRW